MTAAMNPIRRPAEDHEQLHRLVDGRLPPAEAEQARAALDAAELQQAAGWQQQRALLQGLHGDWLHRPLPDPLLRAADRLAQARTAQRRWAAWGGVAAGWMLAFGLGWAVHGQWDGAPRLATAAPAPPLRFVHQAALAHAVYQPERRHPVEVTAAEQEHLVQWLSRRLARPLTAPHLQAQGFELMGGRLLPGSASGSVRAQFMYQNAEGARITLYLGALEDAQAAQTTAFQFRSEGAVSSFYWVDQGFGYALSGELPRPALQALAAAVYRQLEPGAAPAGGASAAARGS